jgi:mRNA-degrading endonuclease RelE of RelBE toxin-antitoxin system
MDGDNPVHRARRGKHRILCSVRGDIIVILDIDHRKDVYR